MCGQKPIMDLVDYDKQDKKIPQKCTDIDYENRDDEFCDLSGDIAEPGE